MSKKHRESEASTASWKNESARQRWDLFHRAIAHAKQSNGEALLEAEDGSGEGDRSGPLLSIVR